jgi:hypothetical protein
LTPAFAAAAKSFLPEWVWLNENGSSSPCLDRCTGPKPNPVMPESINRRATLADTITSPPHDLAISALFGILVMRNRRGDV